MMRWLLFFGRMSQQRPFPAIGLAKKNPLLVTTIAGGLLAVANLATYVISVVE